VSKVGVAIFVPFLGDKHQEKNVQKHNSPGGMGKTLSADDDKSQRNRNNRRYQVITSVIRMLADYTHEQDKNMRSRRKAMPGRFELTSTLAKIWHAPDQLRLMDPLPPMHRRGIIAGALLVIIGILLPSGDDSAPTTQTSREASLNLQSQSQPQGSGNQAVPLPPITNTPTVSDADQVAPVAPEAIQDEQPDQAQNHQPSAASQPYQQPAQQQQSAPGIEQQWRTYRIESGKTLAQLFRDHGLPATDVYAMAQVEGAGKPLSSLQTGQTIQVRQNANGVVTGLAIDIDGGQQVLFTRQSNGSFVRAR
jgi:cell envelope opacity-associated protein A